MEQGGEEPYGRVGSALKVKRSGTEMGQKGEKSAVANVQRCDLVSAGFPSCGLAKGSPHRLSKSKSQSNVFTE